MRLLWLPLPAPPTALVPNMTLWGAEYGRYQYVLSYDGQYAVWGASAKYRGNYGKRIDLGERHPTRAEAVYACERHAKLC